MDRHACAAALRILSDGKARRNQSRTCAHIVDTMTNTLRLTVHTNTIIHNFDQKPPAFIAKTNTDFPG